MMIYHCKFDDRVKPKSLKAHPKNRNRHSPEQIERLAKIIEYQGWRYAIKVSKQSGFITSGHGRMMAAIKKKWAEVPVVYQDYVDSDQEYADVQADNAIASWAELDLSGVNLDVPDLGPDFDIDLLGIKDFTIDAADKYEDKDADEVPEVKETSIRTGDLYQLGTHRLLCGDSTDKILVERLMNGEKADMVYTDPPYGMNLDTDHNAMYAFGDHTHTGNRFKKIEGDDEKYDPSPIFKIKAKRYFIWGCDYFYENLPPEGSFIAWDKRNENLDKVPGNTTEFCFALPSVRRSSIRLIWSGHYGMSGIDAGTRVHPTQKPIRLAEQFFENWGKDASMIVDLYLGSGSTLIACEKTNRRCFGMEIDPQYCQVIIDRWEKFTNQKAEKLD